MERRSNLTARRVLATVGWTRTWKAGCFAALLLPLPAPLARSAAAAQVPDSAAAAAAAQAPEPSAAERYPEFLTQPGAALDSTPGIVQPGGGAGGPVDTLTLEGAVRLALARSPVLREAEGSRMSARAARYDSWGRLVPSLGYTSGFTRSSVLQRTSQDPFTGGTVTLPESLVETRMSFGAQRVLSARWDVFDGGQTYWEIRRASAQAEAADLAYASTRARVAADVALAYLDALESVAQEGARRAQLESARQLARVAAERFRVGEVPEIDDLQARLAESDAEIALLESESATDAARLSLFANLGLGPATRLALIEPAAPDSASIPSEDELRRRAMEESAELAALRGDREAAERGLDAQKWWFLPRISLGIDWYRSEFGNNSEAFTLNPSNEQTTYSLGVSWTPFDRRGGLIADRRRARADVYTAEGRLASREASLARDVEVALGRLRRARLLEQKSRLNLDLARQQREQAAERYRLGLAPIVERLTAEALAADADRQAIAARYATLRSLAELERAAGIRLTSGDGGRASD
jgi:outer membrane protein